MEGVPTNLTEIANELQRGGTPPQHSVRTLLSWFGKKGRGSTVVQTIRSALNRAGLKTVPDFAIVYLDADVELQLTRSSPRLATNGGASAQMPKEEPAEVYDEPVPIEAGTRVAILPSATLGVVSVVPNEPLSNAITTMMVNDYSQLPVMSNTHTVRGVVSWKSIGQSHALDKRCKEVRDCMSRDYELVRVDQPLLDVLPKIIHAEFVLVRDSTARITGIVTATDVSKEFLVLVEPYMLLGEIENQIRQLIDSYLPEETILGGADPRDTSRTVSSVDDLTFGEYEALLDNPTNWGRLPFHLERRVFLDRLKKVRQIRNDVMHFNQDGIQDADRVLLRSLAHFLQVLTAVPARGMLASSDHS